MVSTLDSESSDPSSSLGRTLFAEWKQRVNNIIKHTCVTQFVWNECKSDTFSYNKHLFVSPNVIWRNIVCPAEHSNMATWKAITQQCPASMAMPKSDNWQPTSMHALAGNRTQVNCFEGSYANHYTTNARNLPFIMKFKWVKANELSNMIENWHMCLQA